MSDAFLDPEEIAELTGIRGGYKGKTREQRQIDQLKAQKVPFFLTVAGRPKVARAVIEGRQAAKPEPVASWEPGVMAHG
jgi:hypothetical protein